MHSGHHGVGSQSRGRCTTRPGSRQERRKVPRHVAARPSTWHRGRHGTLAGASPSGLGCPSATASAAAMQGHPTLVWVCMPCPRADGTGRGPTRGSQECAESGRRSPARTNASGSRCRAGDGATGGTPAISGALGMRRDPRTTGSPVRPAGRILPMERRPFRVPLGLRGVGEAMAWLRPTACAAMHVTRELGVRSRHGQTCHRGSYRGVPAHPRPPGRGGSAGQTAPRLGPSGRRHPCSWA